MRNFACFNEILRNDKLLFFGSKRQNNYDKASVESRKINENEVPSNTNSLQEMYCKRVQYGCFIQIVSLRTKHMVLN